MNHKFCEMKQSSDRVYLRVKAAWIAVFAAGVVVLGLCFSTGDRVPDETPTSRRLHGDEHEGCAEHDLDFIMIDGDENIKALADNIADMLHDVGFHVNVQLLSKEDFNAAHEAGNFHLSFTETWGAPYDPHAYTMGWVSGDEGAKVAMSNLTPPYTREQLFREIEDVLLEENLEERELKWKSIHKAVHKQAVFLPLWGKRIPTVLSDRLTGYEAGTQQFDYPVHRLEVVSGSSTVTIAPGAQTGAFESVGRLDPHSYRPNEFFASNWVYEGLVQYGPQGQILPALATSWTILEADGEDEGSSSGETYSFSLRPNVTFHDGAPWNCAAASLNLDHVLVEPFLTPDYHGWHQLVYQISSWECLDNMTLAITTKVKYYPLLQELSFIRPLRMLSPSAFVGGADPELENSCPVDWGEVATPDGTKKVVCAGVLNISGTGPWQFESRISRNVTDPDSGEVASVDDQVTFVPNENHWGSVPAIDRLVVRRFEDSDAVLAALQDGTLDVVWGAGILSSSQLRDLHESQESTPLTVFHSEDVQNTLLLLNTGRPPLDQVRLRQALIHSIDKVSLIESELGGFEKPVDNVFPLDAPYCDVDLTPRWDYDLDKALLLNCAPNANASVATGSSSSSSGATSSNETALALGLGLGLGIPFLAMTVAAVIFFRRKRQAEQELLLLKNKEEAVSC